MATEDGLSKTVDWTKDLLVWGNNKKPRKLSEAEVKAFFLTDAEKKAKKEEEEKKQKEAEKESTLDKKVDAASVVKTEAAGSVDKTLPSPSSRQPSQPAAAESVDKTLPSSSQGVKEEILTPALAAWEEVKKKLANKTKVEKEEEEREERKAAGTETPPDWNMSSSSSSSSPKKSSNKAGGASFDKREARGTPAQPPQGSFDKREPEVSRSNGAVDKTAPCEPPLVPGQKIQPSDLDPKNKLEQGNPQQMDLGSFIQNNVRHRQMTWRLKPNKKVAVDWFQTIRLKGGVPSSHIEALKKLKQCGWEVTLMSFCGHKREQEVRGEIHAFRHEFTFDRLCFTRSKCGNNGKFQTCREWMINYLIDDDESILWESSQGGLWVYPIETYSQSHSWCRWTYKNLPLAVDQLVKDVH